MKTMDGIGNNKFASSSPFTPEAPAPSAPPPPSEVKVRTMRSDLASMAKSGGGLPQFENVKVSGLAAKGRGAQEAPVEAPAPKKKGNMLILFAAIAAIAGLGVLGYIGYQRFFVGKAAAPAVVTPSSPSTPIAGVSSTSPTATTPATPFAHVSLFKRSPDQVLTLTLSSSASATSSAALESFNQKLSSLLATANKTSTFMEIDAKDGNGNAMGIADMLAAENATVLDPSFLAANFNPDATFFVYRDKFGSWPGYVISLQSGKNWLFLQSDVAKIESSPAIANFFLTDPGPASPDGFTDSAIASTTVRVLPFLDAPVPTYFLYGWLNGNLILSTSQDGFAAAVAHLQAD